MVTKVELKDGKTFSVDWHEWQPRDICVLTFIQMRGRVLLIVKKRGLGAGKVNAPGGHVEPGETPLHAAVRETQEEVGLTPLHLHDNGILRFAFTNGYTELCHVFTSPSYIGRLTETDEATPFWCKVKEIPYLKMWEDDIHWIPRILAEQTVDDAYIFDDDTLLWRSNG
jgi:8-oxo-dGTP diphosphatase